MRPRIGENDYQILKNKATEFLNDGDKVKVTLRFRGREASRPEMGRKVLDRLSTDLAPMITIEQNARLEGRSMNMVLAPDMRAIKAAKKVANDAELAELAAMDGQVAEVEPEPMPEAGGELEAATEPTTEPEPEVEITAETEEMDVPAAEGIGSEVIEAETTT